MTLVEKLDALLTELQGDLRSTIQICHTLLDEKASLIAWQQEAVTTLTGWQRCVELVPSTYRPVGARAADCVFAYIDHLQNETAAQRDEIRRLLRALQTYGEQHAENEHEQATPPKEGHHQP